MLEPEERARLEALDKRIDALKAAGKPVSTVEKHHSQAQAGWRMVTELVAGLLIGFAIGYGLDSLFGTLPILMVIFTMLGFAAGVRVMLRTAKEIQATEEAAARETGAPTNAPDEGK